MQTITKLLATTMLMSGAFASGSVAQQADEEEFVFEEIVVTATKRNVALQDVPASVSAITTEQIKKLGFTDLESYTSYIAGLNSQSLGAPGSRSLILRGISAGDDPAATVGVYVDDVQFGSSTAFAAGGRLALDIVPFDMDRIEVLRGPQGTLYGASTLGGLFKYVTKAPNLNEVEGTIELGLSDLSGGDTAESLKAAINLPISEGVAAFRAAVWHINNAGFIDNSARGEENVNSSKIQGGRLSLLVQMSDDLDLRLIASRQEIEVDDVAAVSISYPEGTPLAGDFESTRVVANASKQISEQFSGTINYNIDGIQLTSITGFSEYTNDFVRNNDLFSVLFGGPAYLAADPSVSKFVQELRLVSPDSDRFEWIIGGFYTKEEVEQDQRVDVLSGPLAPSSPLVTVDLPTDYEEIAVFGNLTYYFTENFDLTLGARYSNNKQNYSQTTFGPLFGFLTETTITNNSEEGVMTYLINPRWRPSDDVTVYFRAASGYRPGGPNAIVPDPVTGEFAAPAEFLSDDIWNYEVGVKAALFDKKLTLNAALFQIDWSDIQLVANVGGVNIRANGGEARSKGFELEGNFSPTDGFQLGGQVTYTDAQLTEDTPALVGGVDGERLPAVPKWSFALYTDYSFDLTSEIRGFVGGSVRRTGERTNNFAASPTNLGLVLDDFSSIDLRAGFNWGETTLTFYAKNISNTKANISANAIATPVGVITEAFVNRPRQIGATLTFDF